MTYYGGRPAFQLEAVPSAYETLTLYTMPGNAPGNVLDDGHYEVNSTSTGNASTGAWGQPLVPQSPNFQWTDPTPGSSGSAFVYASALPPRT
jgi:hypothetical protein